uniref:Uncharacterized protein n=1 Tax=Triticum urartu TaxID=4572 RepID=A0A8R7V514_TRIUA
MALYKLSAITMHVTVLFEVSQTLLVCDVSKLNK